MVGFLTNSNTEGSMSNHKVQCFFGHQVERTQSKLKIEDNWEKGVAKIISGDVQSLATEDPEDISDAMLDQWLMPDTSRRRRNVFYDFIASPENDKLIETINSIDDLGWTANECKL